MKNANKINYRSGILVFAFLISCFLSYGQSPEKLNYQAAIRDGSGNIKANQNVIISISILQGSVAGTEVFTEAHSVTTNNFGLVNLEIGSVETASFSSIDWSGGPYFVQLTVDGTVMGVSQLLSVPYALYANEAINADNAKNADNAESVNWEDVDNKPTSLTALGIDNPYNVTVKNVSCHTLASVNTNYQKIGNIGTFTKLNDETSVEITFNGRLAVDDFGTPLAVLFELRVDDNASSVGQARATVRKEEEGIQGIRAPIFGYFTGLSKGSHTVSIWAEVSGSTGTATNARISPNCFSSTNMVMIKEFK